MRLPRSRQINQAFSATIQTIKASLREINQQAAKLMGRGNYARAEEMILLGKRVQEYLASVQALRRRLRELRAVSGKKAAKDEAHALWEYYQPILQTIVALDGEATRHEIEDRFASLFGEWLKPGDSAVMARNRPRWKLMIQRARPQMIKEGFLEDSREHGWRLTPEGREAAK